MTTPLAFLPIGGTELVVIGLVAVILFGKRLPEVGRSLGKGFMEFKKGLKDVSDEVQRDVEEAESDDTEKARKSKPAGDGG